MNEVNLPAIEPVTDEDLYAAKAQHGLRQALEYDRRRVAERQAGRCQSMQSTREPSTNGFDFARFLADHKAEIERLRAEVARLTAACAAKDGVIIRFLNAPLAQRDGTPVPSLLLASARAALSDTAGANMIDASGAVETSVFWYNGRYVVELPESMALTRVLIVPVNP